jgi:cobyric acid synthase
MNPVLLKPQSEIGTQVVVQGRVVGNAKARDTRTGSRGCWRQRSTASSA